MDITTLYITISILLCSALIAIAYYLGARCGIPRLKRYKKNLSEAVDELKSTTIEKTISIDCDGIFKYKASAREEGKTINYDVIAEVMVYTTTNRSYSLSQTPKKTVKDVTYYLHRFHWKRGGHISFIGENEIDEYSAPKLMFNHEIKAVSTKGVVFYVTLTPEVITESSPEKKEIDDFHKSVYRNIDKMLDDATCQHRYFAGLITDYRKHLNLRIADELKNKIHPATKSSEEVRRIAGELNKVDKKYRNLKYKLNMYGIKNVDDITLEDAKYLQAAQEYLKKTKLPKE